MDISTIEDRIKSEWNVVRSFVALHPYASLLIAAAVGNVIGAAFGV